MTAETPAELQERVVAQLCKDVTEISGNIKFLTNKMLQLTDRVVELEKEVCNYAD